MNTTIVIRWIIIGLISLLILMKCLYNDSEITIKPKCYRKAANKFDLAAASSYQYSFNGLLGIPFGKMTWIKLKSLLLPLPELLERQMVISDIVLLTASSSNHFEESITAITSALETTNSTIIYYDLGLLTPQADQIKSWCNVEYRLFDFNKYPGHVTNLSTYAFKPLIISEVLKKHHGVFWFDASVRFNPSFDLSSVLNFTLKNGGFTSMGKSGANVFGATHARMYTYLPTYMTKTFTVMVMATSMMILQTEEIFYDVLIPWYMCALDQMCIAPVNQLYCDMKLLHTGTNFANCHRYDQSAISILIMNKWDFQPSCYMFFNEDVIKVERWADKNNRKTLKVCNQTKIIV